MLNLVELGSHNHWVGLTDLLLSHRLVVKAAVVLVSVPARYEPIRRDYQGPIRGQYSGHMISIHQDKKQSIKVIKSRVLNIISRQKISEFLR